jgi:polyisoprenoid-binding protein YceI
MRDPAKRKRRILILAGGVLGVAVAAFLLIYFVFFPTSSPKPFSLTQAASSDTAAGTSTSSSTGSTSTSAASGGSLAGTWNVSSGSLAGYRVREKLAFLPAQSDAVGRTSQITGKAAFTQVGKSLQVNSASFSIAVNTLASDRSQRDEKIHSIGLESDRFPTATFALEKPLTLSVSAIEGKVAKADVSGTFEIHGVKKAETLPVEFTLSGSTLQAAGRLTFPWSEFGMTAPSVGGFVSVTGKATLEFDLHLTRA